MRKALISGITGQDGAYLTAFLLEKNYEVHGILRRASTFNTDRINHLYRDPHSPGTGESYSVRDFLDEAAGRLNLDWHKFVELDPRYVRPTEVDHLLGDSSKGRRILGFKPKVAFT
jgi:GDP-D-mannose dehydratase